MANLGFISQIDPTGSGDVYTLRDPNAGSPLIATGTILTGYSGVGIAGLSSDWNSVNYLETVCSSPAIDATVELYTGANPSLYISIPADATTDLTFKVLGRTL